MYGKGILKGLGVTWKRFWSTYIDDIAWLVRGKKRYYNEDGVRYRSSTKESGIFTVQYPEEKLIIPEEFRYVPFLVYDDVNGQREIRCTSCGICAKVCPPQCIWIVRTKDPNTGRPKPEPAEFAIDVTICMNCGSCAEFCPFDAIKMDHDYEHAAFERFETLVFKKDKLLKPDTYHYQIHPSAKALEVKPKREKESAA